MRKFTGVCIFIFSVFGTAALAEGEVSRLPGFKDDGTPIEYKAEKGSCLDGFGPNSPVKDMPKMILDFGVRTFQKNSLCSAPIVLSAPSSTVGKPGTEFNCQVCGTSPDLKKGLSIGKRTVIDQKADGHTYTFFFERKPNSDNIVKMTCTAADETSPGQWLANTSAMNVSYSLSLSGIKCLRAPNMPEASELMPGDGGKATGKQIRTQ